jgi:hypothetical protein
MTRLALVGVLLTSAATLAIAIAVGNSGAPTGPGLERPLLGAVLFTAPAAIGLAGAWRRAPAILVAAGMLCLLQSVLSFSGVTIVYLPAALAFFLASGRNRVARPPGARVPVFAGSAVIGVLVVGLVIAGWVVANGSTREVCWVERQGAGGLVRETIPAGEDPPLVVNRDVVATGCDSGIPTTQGVLLALGLAGLAIGAAVLAPTSPPPPAAPAT